MQQWDHARLSLDSDGTKWSPWTAFPGLFFPYKFVYAYHNYNTYNIINSVIYVPLNFPIHNIKAIF